MQRSKPPCFRRLLLDVGPKELPDVLSSVTTQGGGLAIHFRKQCVGHPNCKDNWHISPMNTEGIGGNQGSTSVSLCLSDRQGLNDSAAL
jgi:hypothetical protein